MNNDSIIVRAGMAYRETEKMRLRKAAARQRIAECAYQCVAEGGFRNAKLLALHNLRA